MWLFARHGFFSIVEDKIDSDKLMVRARMGGDIEKYWPDAIVEETPDGDYLFRTSLPRKEVIDKLSDITESIDYQNYKNSISDKDRRAKWYSRVWSIMAFMQDEENA